MVDHSVEFESVFLHGAGESRPDGGVAVLVEGEPAALEVDDRPFALGEPWLVRRHPASLACASRRLQAPLTCPVVTVSLTAPAAGNVTVMSTTTVREDTAGQYVACSITRNTSFDTDFIQRWRSPGVDGQDSQLAGTRVFAVAAGEAVTFRLVCKNLTPAASSNVYGPTIAAMFTPAA